jgi:hypothetical protein
MVEFVLLVVLMQQDANSKNKKKSLFKSLSIVSRCLSIPAPKFGAPQLGPETQSDDFVKNAYNFN